MAEWREARERTTGSPHRDCESTEAGLGLPWLFRLHASKQLFVLSQLELSGFFFFSCLKKQTTVQFRWGRTGCGWDWQERLGKCGLLWSLQATKDWRQSRAGGDRGLFSAAKQSPLAVTLTGNVSYAKVSAWQGKKETEMLFSRKKASMSGQNTHGLGRMFVSVNLSQRR
jgi:hypothetical protein